MTPRDGAASLTGLLHVTPRSRRDEDVPLPDPDALAPVAWIPTRPWAFLWHFTREGFLGRYGAMIASVILAQIADTIEPYALKRMVNWITVATTEPGAAAEVFFWFAIMVALWFASTILFRVYHVIDIYTAPAFRERVQNQMFGYLLGHSPRYFQDTFAGKLGTKIKEAGRASISILELLTFDTVKILAMLIVALVLLAIEEAWLAGLLAAWMIFYVAISAALARRCVALSRSMSDAVSTSSGKLIDAIANADSIRSFANWRFERWFLGDYLKTERTRSRRLRWFLSVMRIFQGISVLSMLAIFAYVGITHTIAGAMDMGTFMMIFTLTNLIGLNVWNLSNRMLDFFEQTGTLTEAIELVTQPHEIVDAPAARPLAVTGGAIRLEGVHFRHPESMPLFEGLDLAIRPGERIGLVGASGAGKSTLVKLLRRHFEPQAGRILIDGQDIARATWDSVNEAIAEVSQSPTIFHRPIRENIRYGRLDATDDEVIEAAKQAHCHEFVVRRPKGYDTVVGEQGIKLSGGERQRVAIARALLKNAPILVLDEATSSLDSESEHYIQQALWALMQGRTVIAIAHRLSTIATLDRIICMDRGRIVEAGTHAELLARGQHYANLWNRQVGGFIGVN